MKKGLSLAIDSPAESQNRRRNPAIGIASLENIDDDIIGDEDDVALIDEANLQIDGGNFFGGPGGASKKQP